MGKEIKVHKSNKRGFGNQESHIITRGKTSYLRIVGNYPSYSLMTATASEDDRSFYVCGDKIKLVASAIQLGSELNIPPSFEKDRSGRNFIRICAVNFNPDAEQEDLDELRDVLERFFEIFDASNPSRPEALEEMQEIYASLAPDDSNDDVYLSDGVWLSSDGCLHDRGR